MYTRLQHDFYITRWSCRLTVSRRVPPVKQVLPTLPENLTSLVLNEVHVAESSVFCVAFYGVFFVLLSVLFLDIVIVCLSINNFWLIIYLVSSNFSDTKSSFIIKHVGSSWSYGSWIYNYLCNQCLSPLMLWVRIPLRQGELDTTLCDKVCQSLAGGFLVVLRFPPQIKGNGLSMLHSCCMLFGLTLG